MSSDNQKKEISKQTFVDIHCHCLPGIDDGPENIEMSLALCRMLADDGVSDVIATPHQLGRYGDYNNAAKIRRKVVELNERLRENGICLSVAAGADVRVDERICELLGQDKICTLADGGKYILLELPHEVFIDIEPLLVELSEMGIEAIVSHPERHPVLREQSEILKRWMECSAHVQITAGSVLGDFGKRAKASATELIRNGFAGLVATDAHNVAERAPCMNRAFEEIASLADVETATLLCVENPSRVLCGERLWRRPFSGLRKEVGAASG